MHGRGIERSAIERMAAAKSVAFQGLRLDSPIPLLSKRIAQRTGDASDTTVATIRRFANMDAGHSAGGRVPAADNPEVVIAAARPLLSDQKSG